MYLRTTKNNYVNFLLIIVFTAGAIPFQSDKTRGHFPKTLPCWGSKKSNRVMSKLQPIRTLWSCGRRA